MDRIKTMRNAGQRYYHFYQMCFSITILSDRGLYDQAKFYKRSAQQWPNSDYEPFTPPATEFFGELSNIQRAILERLFTHFIQPNL